MHSARTVTIVELELIRRFRWMAAAVVLDCTDILLQILSLAIPIRNRTPMTTVTTVRYALPDLLELLN